MPSITGSLRFHFLGVSVGRQHFSRTVFSIRARSLTAFLFTATAIAICPYGQVKAQTQQQVIEFNVPAGSLFNVLTAVGRQAGLQIAYRPDGASQQRSPGVAGKYSRDEALARALQGSGLTYRFSANGSVTISRAADVGSSTHDASTNLEPIILRGGSGGASSDAPYKTAGSSAIISQEQIDRYRGTSVGDFLNGIPGVMNGDGRNSGAIDVNIRGMQGQGRVPVIVDGASQETTVYQGYNGSTARSYVDPDFISSVSIEKGPSMGADATGATGGVVRMSTVNVDDILLPGKNFGVRVKGSFNTNSTSSPSAATPAGMTGTGSYYYPEEIPASFGGSDGMDRPAFLSPTGGSGSIVTAGSTEFLDILAGYARRKTGNYYAGSHGSDAAHPVFTPLGGSGGSTVTNGGLTPYRAGEEVLNTSIDNESWLGKVKIKIDNDQSLELGYSRYMSEYGHILGSQAIGVFGGTYQGRLSTIDLDTYTGRYQWNPEDNDLIDLKVDTFLTKIDNRINSTFNSGGTLYPQYFWVGSERWGVTASNTSRLYTDLGDFSLQYGGAFTRETVGLPDGIRQSDVAGLGAARTGSRNEASGFTSLEWKPLDWLTWTIGGRYSHFSSTDRGVRDNSTGNILAPIDKSDGGWSPSTTVMIEPLDGVQIYGKYSSTLRSPSVFETLTSGSFGVPVAQNPVDPERNRSFEFGVNYLNEGVFAEGDKLRLHGAYFDNHISNYITRSNIPYKSPFSGQTVYSLGRVNLDYADMRGIELGGDYDTGKYFGGISWNHYTDIMFCAREGSVDPRYTRCGAGGIFNSFALQQVPPKDTVTVNLGGRFLDDRLTVGSRMTFVGKRFVEGIGDGSENTSTAPGVSSIRPSKWNPYTLVDVYASYKVNEGASLDLSVDNLFDRYYVDALNTITVPGPGRTIRASFSVKF
jgi:hemoglobin/transferrin/lactoferrin receptor protein